MRVERKTAPRSRRSPGAGDDHRCIHQHPLPRDRLPRADGGQRARQSAHHQPRVPRRHDPRDAQDRLLRSARSRRPHRGRARADRAAARRDARQAALGRIRCGDRAAAPQVGARRRHRGGIRGAVEARYATRRALAAVGPRSRSGARPDRAQGRGRAAESAPRRAQLRRGHRVAEAARRGDPRLPRREGARARARAHRRYRGSQIPLERVTARARWRSAAPRAEPKRASGGDAAGQLFHVSKSYVAGTYALRDVSLEFKRGEFVFLTGPSGAGKTSLLRLVFAAERPSEGQIVVLGRNASRLSARSVPELRRRIGVVFQDFKLLARRTVEENVALALDVVATPRRVARTRVFEMLKQVGLQHRRYQSPLSLSGGEQQRVAIARALINEPDILLADEPTGNLDPDLTLEIMDLIADTATRGTTVIVATHDQSILDRYRKRTVRLENGRVTEDRAAPGTSP